MTQKGTAAGLLYGSETRGVTIPAGVEALVLRPGSLPVAEDLAGEVRRALNAPIGAPPLAEHARGARDAIILVSDLTREVPDSVIVPMILGELNAAGIKDDKITLMVAGGTHRKITSDEARQRLGPDVLARVRLVPHDASDQSSLVRVGTTSHRTPVWVNRLVVETDLVIGTGCIIPHVIAGYGGGRKVIVPGAAGAETIRVNHRPANVNAPGVGFCRLEGNVVHEDLMEAARMVGLDYIVNVVWNADGRLVRAVAGDMGAAWLEGVRAAEEMYTVKIAHQYDILVTSGGGMPTDVNFYQAVRGMQVGVPALRDGGPVVLAAECREGVGSAPLYEWLRDAACPEDVLRRRDRDGFDIHGEHIACYLCERILPKHQVFLVSSLPDEIVADMMMIPAASVQEAFERARQAHAGRSPSVLVNPYGARAVPKMHPSHD